MSSTSNLFASVRRRLVGVTLLGSLAFGAGAAATQAHASVVPPMIGVNATTLSVSGQGFARGGIVQLYLRDTDTGMWFDATGAETWSQVPNGTARAGTAYVATLCGSAPHQSRCYRPNAWAGAFSYMPHISAPVCNWANDSLQVAAYDTRSRQWASMMIDYNNPNATAACQDSTSQDAPDPPDAQDPPSPPDPGD